MNLLVVGASYRTAPVATAGAAGGRRRRPRRHCWTAWSPSRTSARRWSSPPATGSRSTPRSPASTAASPTSARSSPSRPARPPATSPATSTCTTTPTRSSTPSGSPPGWTRWWSARRRSSASSGTPTTAPPSADTAGRLLHELMQQALRVGKRAHAETGIDRAGQSVVTAALDLAAGTARRRPRRPAGAGGRGRRDGRAGPGHALPGPAPARCTVTNRSADRAGAAGRARTARSAVADRRPGRRAAPRWTSWSAATASTEPVLTRDVVLGRAGRPGPRPGPLVLLDLAVPARRRARGRPSCPASR